MQTYKMAVKREMDRSDGNVAVCYVCVCGVSEWMCSVNSLQLYVCVSIDRGRCSHAESCSSISQ